VSELVKKVEAHAKACREARAEGRPRPPYRGADLGGANLRGAIEEMPVVNDIRLVFEDPAQVAGAGLMYEAQYLSPRALDIATVTKLVRNLCMVAVIPLVGFLYAAEGRATGRRAPLWTMIPWFIFGFALMSALRTVGDLGDEPFGFLSPAAWDATVQALRGSAEHLLLVAMAAVGLTTDVRGLAAIGPRPFLLGLFAAAVIGAVSLLLIVSFGPRLLSAVGA